MPTFDLTPYLDEKRTPAAPVFDLTPWITDNANATPDSSKSIPDGSVPTFDLTPFLDQAGPQEAQKPVSPFGRQFGAFNSVPVPDLNIETELRRPITPERFGLDLTPKQDAQGFADVAANAGKALLNLGFQAVELPRKLITGNIQEKADALMELSKMLPAVREDIRSSLGEVIGPWYDAIIATGTVPDALKDYVTMDDVKAARQRIIETGGMGPVMSLAAVEGFMGRGAAKAEAASRGVLNEARSAVGEIGDGSVLTPPISTTKPGSSATTKPTRPKVPIEPDLSLEAIKKMPDAELRNEAYDLLGRDYAAEQQVARMSRPELESVVSGGRIKSATSGSRESISDYPSPVDVLGTKAPVPEPLNTRASAPPVEPPRPIDQIKAAPAEKAGPTSEPPSIPEGVKPPTEKQPWEMTADEWLSNVKFYRSNGKKSIRFPSGETAFLRDQVRSTPSTFRDLESDYLLEHRMADIKKAHAAGEPIPPEVLAEYPDLVIGKSARPDKTTLASPRTSNQVPVSLESKRVGVGVNEQNITDFIRDKMNVPVLSKPSRAKGAGKIQGAAGTYETFPEVIRSQVTNDPRTILHEVGHHLQKTQFADALTNAPKAVTTELEALGKQLYGEKKPAGGYASEGFAEFFYNWTATGEAARIAPKAAAYFDKAFAGNKAMSASLASLRDMVTEYREQGAVKRFDARIDSADKMKAESTKGKMTAAGRRVRTTFLDDMLPLELTEKRLNELGGRKSDYLENFRPEYENQIETSPTLTARYIKGSQRMRAVQFATKGVSDFGKSKIKVPGIQQVLEPFRTREFRQEAVNYTIAKRMVDLADKGRKIPGDWVADARYYLEHVDRPKNANGEPIRSLPAYDQAAAGITKYFDTLLDYVVDGGGLSKEAADAMRDGSQVYISLRRAFRPEERRAASMGGGGGIANVGKPGSLKKVGAHETRRPIANPVESMIQVTEELISMGDRARVGQLLTDMVSRTEGSGMIMTEIARPVKSVKFNAKQLKAQLEEMGADLSAADLDKTATIWGSDPAVTGKGNVVSFWKDGELKYWEITDPELYNALRKITRTPLHPWFDATIGRVGRGLRLGATGINASFNLITNPLRDPQTLAIQTQVSLADLAKATGTAFTKDMSQAFDRANIGMAQPLGMDRGSKRLIGQIMDGGTVKAKLKGIVRHPIEVAQELVSFPEAIPRKIEYAAVKGKFPAGSRAGEIAGAMAAKDVTVNFGRMGTAGPVLNALYPYFNANIQGLSKLYRTARHNPRAAITKATLGLTIPTLALWWQNKDKDWYKAMAPWERLNFWHFEVGTDNVMRLPRPFEWGNLYSAAPEAIADALYQNDPKAFKEWLNNAAANTTPVDFSSPSATAVSLTPHAIMPLVEVAANYDFFRDRNIVPHYMTDLDPEAQVMQWTPDLVKAVGGAIGVAPLKIEHLLSGYTGGMSKSVLYGIDRGREVAGMKAKTDDGRKPQARDYPVVGVLFSRNVDPEIELRKLESIEKRITRKYNERIARYQEIGDTTRVNRAIIDAATEFQELYEREVLFIEMWKKQREKQ